MNWNATSAQVLHRRGSDSPVFPNVEAIAKISRHRSIREVLLSCHFTSLARELNGMSTKVCADSQTTNPENRAAGDRIELRAAADGTLLVGTIACESRSTIAAVVDCGPYYPGDVMNVCQQGSTRTAWVRRADEQSDGSWLLTLRWCDLPVFNFQ
jgi:hypothetical protein